MNRIGKAFIGATAVAIGLLVTANVLRAQSAPLTSRLPHGANAAMTIDVTKLLQSPMGKQQELQSKLLSGYADRPLAIPATARKVAVAAAVDPTGLQSVWQVALIDLPNPPRVDPMVRVQGGYLDKVEGKNIAWSKRGIMYVEMDDHTLGVVRPGARQFVARWLTGKTDVGLNPKLAGLLAAAKDADGVFALDLDGAVGTPSLNYALAMGQFPSLEKLESSQPALVKAIASVTDLRVGMKFTDKIEGECVINFGQSVAGLGSDVKPFIVDVLQAAGLNDDNVQQNWEFKAEGNKIVGKGPVELIGLTRLVALLAPGDVGQPAAGAAESTSEGGGTPPSTADPKNAAAAASQKYYRAISKSLDSIAGKASPTQGASWLLAQARQFEQLPVLNVDPDLVAWGQSVTQGYMQAAQELALGQQKAKLAAEGIASPTGYTTDAPNGGGSDTAETRAAYKNAQQQRRVAAQNERGAAAQRALDIFNQLASTRGKIRADMTQKYGVEF
jgi:hypothetical protein